MIPYRVRYSGSQTALHGLYWCFPACCGECQARSRYYEQPGRVMVYDPTTNLWLSHVRIRSVIRVGSAEEHELPLIGLPPISTDAGNPGEEQAHGIPLHSYMPRPVLRSGACLAVDARPVRYHGGTTYGHGLYNRFYRHVDGHEDTTTNRGSILINPQTNRILRDVSVESWTYAEPTQLELPIEDPTPWLHRAGEACRRP